MTTEDALTQLLAINSWLRLPTPEDGKPFGPGFFQRRNWRPRLGDKNRKVAFRLRQYAQCLACRAHVTESSTGDHLIPLSQGGPDDASNYVPLCRRCNASKGGKDFAVWWREKGYSIRELPVDIVADLICAYARLTYQMAKNGGYLGEVAPEHLQAFLSEAKEYVPKSHWKSLERVK